MQENLSPSGEQAARLDGNQMPQTGKTLGHVIRQHSERNEETRSLGSPSTSRRGINGTAVEPQQRSGWSERHTCCSFSRALLAGGRLEVRILLLSLLWRLCQGIRERGLERKRSARCPGLLKVRVSQRVLCGCDALIIQVLLGRWSGRAHFPAPALC